MVKADRKKVELKKVTLVDLSKVKGGKGGGEQHFLRLDTGHSSKNKTTD